MLQHDRTTCRIVAGPSQDWPSFTQRLAETLGALADGQYLILAATHIQRYVPRPGHEPVAATNQGAGPRRRTGSGAGRWNSRLPPSCGV